MDEEKKIEISMEEYKELLMIKGKYEELKNSQPIYIPYKEKEYPDWTLTRATTTPFPKEQVQIY